MPRYITDKLRAWLKGETLQYAICVKLVTPAPFSVVMGFTTWDIDIVYNGVTYEANNAIVGSAVSSNIGTGVDNMEVTGLLESTGLTDEDIMSGKYDNSRLTLFVVNPADLTMLDMRPIAGVLGDFKTDNNKFIVELRSLTQLMSQQVGDNLLPTCMARFGDRRCKFDTVGGVDSVGNPVRSVGTVTVVEDQYNLKFSGIVSTGGFYTNGMVQFTSGANTNIKREIKVHGDPNTLVSQAVLSSPSPLGNVPFNSNTLTSWLTQCGTNFTFAIPAGNWTQAYIGVRSSWSRNSSTDNQETGLYIQLPTGQQYLVVSESTDGVYGNSLELSAATITAINVIAGGGGGNISGCMQFHNATGVHLQNVSVTELSLVLIGQLASVSNLISLEEPFPFPVSPGDTAYLTAGCDLLLGTCDGKWQNKVNFRGFATIPGVDMILKSGHQ